jgi:glycosyltransferase involved in cell wall biosynthesis
MADSPLVSVLTPSFNQGAWLLDNLRSVARQTYPHVEHIVMDGGSTDQTTEVLIGEAGPKVVWRSEVDQGQSDALNKAFRESSGEIIGWLNSDDAYFGPTAIEDAVAILMQDPSAAAVYGHAVLADARGLVLQILWAPSFNRRLLRLHDYIVQPAVFVRRGVLEERFVDESFDYAMDYELWLRLANRHRLRRVDRIVAVDRHHKYRKSYTMAAIGDADHQRLAARYGVHRGFAARVVRKIWKVASRFAGVRFIPSATNDPVVFETPQRSATKLFIRQVATPRSFMRSPDT